MKLARVRAGAILLFSSLLQACGGGGGDGGAPDPGPTARLSISTSNVSALGTPGDLAPEDVITFTVTDDPPDQLYVAFQHSMNGLDHIEFNQTGPAEGTIKVVFRSPGSLLNGTYTDTIEVRVCFDIECRTDVNDSPTTVSSSYVVSGEGKASATLSRNAIELTADQREVTGRRESLTATIADVPPSGLHVNLSSSSNAIDSVSQGAVGSVTDMLVDFRAGSELAVGTYNDSVAVKLCYADNCVRQVAGSPFAIPTTLSVTLGVEPGLPTLPFLSREPLGHDVIDADFSAAMNAIVMVGSTPLNAIYVYDIDDGIESAQLLGKAPAAISVSPDGLTAAVGHDAFISVVDLPMVGAAGAPAPTLLNVSIPVHDIALDGNGHVYAVPIYEQGDNVHAVDIATNTEQQAPAFVERIRMLPGAEHLYGLPDSAPSDLRKWDVASGVPSYLYSWQYFSEHTACLDFWFNETGDRIYTACGETFSASADPAQDMIYAGTIPITEPATYLDHYIRSLSHSEANDEIALIEWHFFDCEIGPLYRPCYTRLAYFDDALYNRKAIYGIGPVTVGDVAFAQRGRYVFHDAQSSRKYLIGELEEPLSEDQRFWLIIVE